MGQGGCKGCEPTFPNVSVGGPPLQVEIPASGRFFVSLILTDADAQLRVSKDQLVEVKLQSNSGRIESAYMARKEKCPSKARKLWPYRARDVRKPKDKDKDKDKESKEKAPENQGSQQVVTWLMTADNTFDFQNDEYYIAILANKKAPLDVTLTVTPRKDDRTEEKRKQDEADEEAEADAKETKGEEKKKEEEKKPDVVAAAATDDQQSKAKEQEARDKDEAERKRKQEETDAAKKQKEEDKKAEADKAKAEADKQKAEADKATAAEELKRKQAEDNLKLLQETTTPSSTAFASASVASSSASSSSSASATSSASSGSSTEASLGAPTTASLREGQIVGDDIEL